MLDLRSLASLTPDRMVGELAVLIYEPPLFALRTRLREVPEPLRVFILVIDFDTEVAGQGMLGFLENSTGRYLPETIDALGSIGAHVSAATLRRIEKIMTRHGVTHTRLREDFARAKPGQITTFSEMHGGEFDKMGEEIHKEAAWFTCDDTGDEPLRRLLVKYVANERSRLLDALFPFSIRPNQR
jgi:hypothetical protein